MKFYVRVARTISHDWRQRTSDILFFRGILWKSLDPSGFSSRCYRSLIAWKMHLHLCRLTVLTTTNLAAATIPSNKQTKFIQQGLKGGNRDVVTQYDHSCYIRKVGHSVPRWPLNAVIVFLLKVFLVSTVNTLVQLIFSVLFFHTSNLVQAVSFGTIGGSLWAEYANGVCEWTPKALVD